MAKVIHCECGFTVRWDTDDEPVAAAQEHAREVMGWNRRASMRCRWRRRRTERNHVQARVRLTGEMQVETQRGVLRVVDFPGRQGRLVFARLAATPHPVPRDVLADIAWPLTE